MIATIGNVKEVPGRVMVETVRPDTPNLSDTVTVLWQDARQITPEQRRKVYALLGELAVWSGNTKDEAKAGMKANFRLQTVDGIHRKAFSLSDCDLTTAREFISFIIDYMVENDVPTARPLIEYADDAERYVYSCLMHRKCAVCGKKSDLHHVDHVTDRGFRNNISHLGLRCLPLCRLHHNEAHSTPENEFLDKYHLTPVTIDERIAKLYRLGGKDKGHE